MLGVRVDRPRFLWRPLGRRGQAAITIVASLLMAVAVVAAFSYLEVSQASGSSAAGDYVTVGSWTCTNDGVVPLLTIDSFAPAADGRGVAVEFSNAQNGSRAQCLALHTNSSPTELLCLAISPASLFGGQATTDTATTPSLSPS